MNLDKTDILLIEKSIVLGLHENIKFLSRGEDGDLWATAKEPSVEGGIGVDSFLALPASEGMEENHSLSAFNHLFMDIKPLTIVELDNKSGE